MKTNLVILAALISGAAFYTWYDGKTTANPVIKSIVSDQKEALARAPDFTFTDIKGKKVTLSDFKGRPVILNFWATWCAPCVIEFPAMLRLADKSPDAVFLFVSLDESGDAIARFMKKHASGKSQKNVFVGRDENTKISAGLYNTRQLPETYLIDSKGYISDKIIGADVDWEGDAMARRIKDISR